MVKQTVAASLALHEILQVLTAQHPTEHLKKTDEI